MPYVLNYSPGTQVTVILQVLDASGVRADGYTTPIVSSVILPDLSTSSLYPLVMTKLATGLYCHKFTLPTGAIAVGSYIVNLSWHDPQHNLKEDFVQVVCSAAYGSSFSVSPG